MCVGWVCVCCVRGVGGVCGGGCAVWAGCVFCGCGVGVCVCALGVCVCVCVCVCVVCALCVCVTLYRVPVNKRHGVVTEPNADLAD